MNVLLCPLSDAGYLYPAIAVGRELAGRDHRVHVLGRAAAAPVAAHAGLPFLAAEERGGAGGFSVGRWRDGGPAQLAATLDAARELRPDVLVTSVLCHGTLLAAEILDLPVIVLGLTTYLWNYRAGGDDEPQPATSRAVRTRDTLRIYDDLRTHVGLPARRRPLSADPLHGTALLLRGHPSLEYPGTALPPAVQHVGPLDWEPRGDAGAELSHVDAVGKPLVYVHLGRFFGGRTQWPRLNAAFTGGPFQAVVEQGRTANPEPSPGADILLVRKPWMRPFLDRAGLVLTSGTSAPVLAALLRGKPLGLSPNGSEQPVLSAACVRAGVGALLLADDDPQTGLRAAWADDLMRARAARLGAVLAAAGGPARAADAVERSVALQPALN
ncbi:glycosyltransferase [Actinokineospora sp. NPDC004072]